MGFIAIQVYIYNLLLYILKYLTTFYIKVDINIMFFFQFNIKKPHYYFYTIYLFNKYNK